MMSKRIGFKWTRATLAGGLGQKQGPRGSFTGLLILGAALWGATIFPGNVHANGVTVTVNTAKIRVADIFVATQGAPITEGCAAVELGPAPLPGASRNLDVKYIRARLRQAGCNPDTVQLPPQGGVTIIRQSQTVTRQQMEHWVRRYLETQLARTAADVELGEIRIGQDVTLPTGRLTHKIVPPKNQQLAGKVPLGVHCYVDGRELKRVWATAKIIWRAEVVVARKPLRRHKVIAPEDIKLVAMDLAQLPSGVLTDAEEVVGRRTQRKIDPNTVLRADLVELPPLVKRKDVVVVLAEAPGLAISTLGEAQENGRLGERIRITNLDSGKRIHAKVVDATTVRVDF